VLGNVDLNLLGMGGPEAVEEESAVSYGT